MENRILLINKRNEVIEEFKKAYASESFQIDVAKTGVEGYQKLQLSHYKVVITGLLLPDIDGNKLLTYIKKNFPDTVCIVYTTKLSVAQLVYLKNKLHVFRIFLRPVDYKEEMLNAIQEAFEAYDLSMEDQEIHENERINEKEHEERYHEMKQRVLEQDEADQYARKIMEPIVEKMTLMGDMLSMDQKQEILRVEKEIIRHLMKETQQPTGGLMSIEVKLRHSFFENMDGKNLYVDIASNVIQFSEDFVENMYLVLWIVIYRINLLTKVFNAVISIDFETSSKLTVNLMFEMDPSIWQRQEEERISNMITHLFESMAEEMCEGIRRDIRGEQVIYHLYFDAKAEPVFVIK